MKIDKHTRQNAIFVQSDCLSGQSNEKRLKTGFVGQFCDFAYFEISNCNSSNIKAYYVNMEKANTNCVYKQWPVDMRKRRNMMNLQNTKRI